MNLTDQMLMREMLIMLEQSADRVPPLSQNTVYHRELARVTEVARQMLAPACANCQQPMNLCQCEHAHGISLVEKPVKWMGGDLR